MAAKTTTVALVAGEQQRDFEFSHAERLLALKKNGGWHLPADSKWEYNGNGLQRRTVKRKDNEADGESGS